MKYAADIVLIPPQPIIELIVKLNNADFTKQRVPVKLDFEDYVPHLSLVMGVIDTENEVQIQKKINAIAKQIQKIELKVSHFQESWMSIERTNELMNLHETLMKETYPLFEKDGTEAMYYRTDNAEVIDPTILTWINEFGTKYSFENYKPHITAWTDAVIPKEDVPTSFHASTLALYHLGNYNTCRKLIYSWQLT